MRKRIVTIALCLFIFGSVSFARPQIERETKIYYAVIDEWVKLPPEISKEDYDKIYGIVAKKYNLSPSEVRDIIEKVYARGLSKWEQEVFNEADQKFSALPASASEQESEVVAQKIADKYGISLAVLNEIMWRGLGARMDK